jgi:hypothetical protein
MWESTLLGSNWWVGDCTMLGNYTPTGAPEDARSYARIVEPDSSGHTNVYIFEATQRGPRASHCGSDRGSAPAGRPLRHGETIAVRREDLPGTRWPRC